MQTKLLSLGALLLAPPNALRSHGAEREWRSYEVYEPVIERHFVWDRSKQPLQYNHCSAIAFFKGRWVALWNANLIPDEAKPGQLIHMSTSLDGKTWAAHEIAFRPASPGHGTFDALLPKPVWREQDGSRAECRGIQRRRMASLRHPWQHSGHF